MSADVGDHNGDIKHTDIGQCQGDTDRGGSLSIRGRVKRQPGHVATGAQEDAGRDQKARKVPHPNRHMVGCKHDAVSNDSGWSCNH